MNITSMLAPAFLSTACCNQPHGNFWQHNWNWFGHHHAWTTRFFQYPAGQYPITLA
jgi:hypothetical protein